MSGRLLRINVISLSAKNRIEIEIKMVEMQKTELQHNLTRWFVLWAVLLCCAISQTAVAQQYRTANSYPAAAGEKLVSGVANVATGFVELPKTIMLSTRQDGAAYGLTVGLVTGVMHTIGRTVFGALDAVTFLIPTEPVVRPLYIWRNFDKETTYG